MHSEKVQHGHGKTHELVFRAAVPSRTAPVIAETFTSGNTRYYKDTSGKTHVADICDRVYGIRDPNAILPKQKARFSKSQPFRRCRSSKKTITAL